MNYIEWSPPDAADLISFTTGKNAPFRLVSISELEPVDVTPVSIKSPSQPGETLLDLTVPARVLVIQGLIQADSSDALWTLRRTLARACAAQPTRYGEDIALGTIRMLRSGDNAPMELDCRVKSVKFPMPKGNVGFIGFDIEFYAPNPYWREVADSTQQLSGSGGFEFPLVFTEEFPSNNIEVDITNDGDVDAPPMIQLFGECTNPRIINETTGETIQMTVALTSDQYIEINTAFGQKTIRKYTISTGDYVNAFSSLDPTSDLWVLRPGVNHVRFEADSNVSGYANVAWRQRYSGI